MPSRVGQDDFKVSYCHKHVFNLRSHLLHKSRWLHPAADKPRFFIRPMGNITLNISLVANFSNTNKQECKLK